MAELSRTGLISARIHPINKPKPKVKYILRIKLC